METTLVLVRHGQTVHNLSGRIAGSTDSPLSALGREQAVVVAKHIGETYRLDALYTSPLVRALDTAVEVGQCAGLSPLILEGLREMNFGDLENTTESEIAIAMPETWQASRIPDDLEFAWPNGEARGVFFARARAAFDDIIRRHPGETVGVVGHGAAIGSFLGDIAEGRPWLWQKYLMFNCAVSLVVCDPSRSRIVRYNDVSFLPPTEPDPLILALARD